MPNINLYLPEIDYSFPMVFVQGTGQTGYSFGDSEKVVIHINDFFISKYLVTQRLWEYIMGHNPALFAGPDKPVERVSFIDITVEDGFLAQLQAATGNKFTLNTPVSFRLLSETEWEYAARGGVHWQNGFRFSGSNDLNEVGWYDGNSGKFTDQELLYGIKNHEKGTSTRPVAQKLPNQLGIYDMCGNVWEWCQDFYQPDIQQIPKDGAPNSKETGARVLRGGCHHNGAVHCTVSKRYQITPDFKDECIGFRIAASVSVPAE